MEPANSPSTPDTLDQLAPLSSMSLMYCLNLSKSEKKAAAPKIDQFKERLLTPPKAFWSQLIPSISFLDIAIAAKPALIAVT